MTNTTYSWVETDVRNAPPSRKEYAVTITKMRISRFKVLRFASSDAEALRLFIFGHSHVVSIHCRGKRVGKVTRCGLWPTSPVRTAERMIRHHQGEFHPSTLYIVEA